MNWTVRSPPKYDDIKDQVTNHIIHQAVLGRAEEVWLVKHPGESFDLPKQGEYFGRWLDATSTFENWIKVKRIYAMAFIYADRDHERVDRWNALVDHAVTTGEFLE